MLNTIISLLKKPEYFMLQKSLKKCSGTLLFTEKVTFEYDFGNFLYDSI